MAIQNKEKAGKFRRIVCVLIITLMIPPLIGSAIILPIEKVLMNEGTYIRAIDESNVYEGLPANAADLVQNFQLPAWESNGLKDLFAPPTDTSTLTRIFSHFIIIDWTKPLIDSGIRSILGYINGEQEEFSIPIDFSVFKAKFEGSEGAANLKDAFLSLDICDVATDEEELAIMRDYAVTQTIERIPNCRPDDGTLTMIDLDAIVAEVQGQIEQKFTSKLADTYDLASYQETGQLQRTIISESRLASLRTYRILLAISPIVAVLLIIVLVLILRKSLRRLFSWLGIPFMIAGLVGMLINLISFFMINGILDRYVWQILLNLPLDFATTVLGIAYRISNEYILYAGYSTFALFVLGLLFYLGAKFIKVRTLNDQADPD